MAKIKRGQPGWNNGKTIKKKNPKSKFFEEKLKQEDNNKKKRNVNRPDFSVDSSNNKGEKGP